ncbi:unnamed protein product [Caenorhabditis nigoni]
MLSVLIAGGGLVGCVNACMFGRKGWRVTVFESRSDPRGNALERGRSFNLALGFRAMETLKHIGILEDVIKMGVPIKQKISHQEDKEGVLENLALLKEGDFILTINRQKLSELLIQKAEGYSSVKFSFDHKAIKYDVECKKLLVESPDGSQINVDGDLILACDGAHSTIRRSLLKTPRFNFNQKYCGIGYMDLSVTIENVSELKLGIHYSWRRKGVILVALVNRDRTLTVSLFANFTVFAENCSTPEDSVLFFQRYFSLIYSVIGERHIFDTFSRYKPQAIISVLCSRHGFFDKLLLMGDAAHAMLPFQGQGANCGFEDCLVLQEILEETGEDDLKSLVKKYSEVRTNDTNMMNQMEWEGYVQLVEDLQNLNRSLGWFNKMQSSLKNRLSVWFPSKFTLAAFSRERYSEITRKHQLAQKFQLCIKTTFAIIIIIIAFMIIR